MKSKAKKFDLTLWGAILMALGITGILLSISQVGWMTLVAGLAVVVGLSMVFTGLPAPKSRISDK